MARQVDDRVLAIDVGTTSVKAALLDGRADVLATGTTDQHIRSDGTGRREHDAELTWRAVRRAVERLWRATGTAPAIRAIAVTGPRGSFAIADVAGKARSPVLTWQDRRAAGLVAEWQAATGSDHGAILGFQPTASAVLPKVLWLRGSRQDLFAAPWRIVTPQGDVMRRLGIRDNVIDLTTAGLVGLLDITTQTWSETLLERWSIPTDALPRLVPPGTIVGVLAPAAARDLALSPGLPIVAAGSDGVCSELGASVAAVGQIYAYLGTAGAVAGPLDSVPVSTDPALIVMSGSTPDRRRLLGLMGAGGSARDWAMDLLGIRNHARFDRLVDTAPPGAHGVLAQATLAGATAPEPDSRARGALLGLSLSSDRADVARATLEGVALEMRAIVDAMQGSIPTPVEVALTGGGSRSETWSRIIADVLGLPVRRIREPNPGLRGAAQYALAAIGRFDTALQAAIALSPSSDTFLPDADRAGPYADAAELYALVRRCGHHGGLDARLFQHGSDLAAASSRDR